jgi:hypothetical protein
MIIGNALFKLLYQWSVIGQPATLKNPFRLSHESGFVAHIRTTDVQGLFEGGRCAVDC